MNTGCIQPRAAVGPTTRAPNEKQKLEESKKKKQNEKEKEACLRPGPPHTTFSRHPFFQR
jgi:hypothetical protein